LLSISFYQVSHIQMFWIILFFFKFPLFSEWKKLLFVIEIENLLEAIEMEWKAWGVILIFFFSASVTWWTGWVSIRSCFIHF
jgi:hypothetical protein